MTTYQSLLSGAALGVILSAQTAMADVTPRQVWQDWQDYMLGMGYSLTGTENQSGDTLAISNLTFDLSASPDQGEVTLSLETLSFVQNDDGTVTVMMPDVMPVQIDMTDTGPEAKPVKMNLTLNQTDHNMIVSGTPDEMTSDYRAGVLGMTLDQLAVGDESYGDDTAAMEVALTDVRNTTSTTLDEMRTYTQEGTVASATYDMRFKNPDEPAVAVISGTSADLSYTGESLLPVGLTQVSDMTSLFRAGLDVSANIDTGNSTLTVDIEDPENGNAAAAFATESATLKIESSADGLNYAGTRQGMTGSVQPPEFPFLLSFGMETLAFNLTAPAIKSDEAQDFALGLNLDGFTASDMIWGMLDPQGALPRDPASVSLDLTGKAKLLVDYLDPQAAERMAESGDAPGELQSVALNSLIIDALGARLTGSGQAEFDNDAPANDTGLPPAAGALDLKLVGGNTLLETLVSSGLLPAQTAMGARMMMGMFAVPGEGEDTLTSRFELTRSGSILANGQQIR